MTSLESVKKLREEYERSLDAAESRRVAYHEAVLDLHREGTPLREIAKELGLSHQRVHQIVSSEPPPRRRNLGRAAGGMGGVLLLVAATFGALRLAHAPPFGQAGPVPVVIYHTEGPAARVSRPARPQQGRSIPVALFKANPQGRMNAGARINPKSIWDQKVIPDSVRHVASVQIPAVGPIAFWYGRAKQGGWCEALRLSNGAWLGYSPARRLHLGPGGRIVVRGGAVVPGCLATQEQMHDAFKHRHRYRPTGFECSQAEVDVRSVGELWQIRYGLITAPGAVKVSDRLSGRSTVVVGGRFFILAIRHPRRHLLTMHLVAHGKDGNVVASGRSAFGC